MIVPDITVSPSPDGAGYLLSRGAARLGSVFQVEGGWVSTAYGRSPAGRSWRRSRPFPTAVAAAAHRWGADARAAFQARETEAA